MPFASSKQRKFLHMNKPSVAKKLAKHPRKKPTKRAMANSLARRSHSY